MSLKFKPHKRAKLPDLTRNDLFVEQGNDEQIGLILGHKPGSKEEWRVYQALLANNWEGKILYQQPLQGGRVRGGFIVDFILRGVPRPTPLFVNGDYFHQDTEEVILQIMATRNRGLLDPVIIWDYEIPTQEEADNVVSQRIGNG